MYACTLFLYLLSFCKHNITLFLLNFSTVFMYEQNNIPCKYTDWSECVLYQEVTEEPLQSPENTLRVDTEAGYHTLAKKILRFNEINCLPIQIDIAKLDEGNGIAATFITRKAKWHKSCYNKFNNLKLHATSGEEKKI